MMIPVLPIKSSVFKPSTDLPPYHTHHVRFRSSTSNFNFATFEASPRSFEVSSALFVWTWFEHLYYNRIAKSRCFRQGQIIFCVVDYWWGWSRISHAFSFVENTSLKQVHHLILHITKWSSLDQPLKFSSQMPKQSRHSLASQFEQTKRRITCTPQLQWGRWQGYHFATLVYNHLPHFLHVWDF